MFLFKESWKEPQNLISHKWFSMPCHQGLGLSAQTHANHGCCHVMSLTDVNIFSKSMKSHEMKAGSSSLFRGGLLWEQYGDGGTGLHVFPFIRQILCHYPKKHVPYGMCTLWDVRPSCSINDMKQCFNETGDASGPCNQVPKLGRRFGWFESVTVTSRKMQHYHEQSLTHTHTYIYIYIYSRN